MDQQEKPNFLAGSSDMAALIRAKAWSETPLGPMEDWPQSLRTTVSLCLASNFPINIIWGPEHTQIYNDGYRVVCGEAHPSALGQDYSVTWASAWPAIGEPFARALAGETMFLENQRMFLTRNGYLEETFFTFSTSPIRDESGGIGGLFHPVTETTATMLAERRTRALRDLTAGLGGTTDVDELAGLAVETLARFDLDLPFVLLYALAADGERYHLAAHHGLEPDTGASPATLAADAAAPWPVAEAVGSLGIIEVKNVASMIQGEACGPYEEAPDHAFVLPISVPGLERPPMIAVMGVSARLPLNDTYRGFYELLAAALSAALAAVRARQDERRRAEALAELDRAKTTFFSNVSHEFRTPLTLMLGPLEESLACADQLPAEERERVTLAHRNGLRLLKLVNSLLDFSRIEAGRVQASFEPTGLAAFTAELASNFRSVCEKAGISLIIDAPPLREPIHVDREMWEKIVLNLLSNAFKFTFEGEIRVLVRASADGDAAEVTVSDSGTGISAEELPRLFERFHRVEGARGRSFEGSGIGLALVQELVTLHGGSIRVESEMRRGSAFIVTIPFGSAHLAAEQGGYAKQWASTATRASAFVEEALRWLPLETDGKIHAPVDAQHVSNSATPLQAPRSSGRVLLADDNADMRSYVERLLAEAGFVVEAVADGDAAFEAARQAAPDLILTDVMMPRLDGFGLLHKLRGDPHLHDIPVVLLSARAGEEARVEGLEAGADDYLTKPFAARELVARVSANLNLARDRREAALRESEARLRELNADLERQVTERARERSLTWHVSPDLLGVLNRDGYFESSNPAWQTTLGWSEAEIRATKCFDFLHPDDLDRNHAAFKAIKNGKPALGLENRYRQKNGGYRWLSWVAVPEGDKFYCSARDITAEKERAEALAQAEEALRQSQKMEAVGQLTGGLAHDFNNLLTGIAGSLELLQSRMAQGRLVELDRYVTAAQGAAKRAATLTHRLLAFSRRQTLDPKPTDLNRLIVGMEELIRRTMGPPITVEVVMAGGLWTTLIDPGQLESALLNLCINARDAMPDSGRLTIETANKWLDPRAAHERELSPGQFVALCVSDNGSGMTPEVIRRAFDPFYTTKPIGMGTGLGLSMVYGFTRQSGGQTRIYSEPGQGTMICLYLPRHFGKDDYVDLPSELPSVPLAKQSGTVLVVDDEPTVRMLVIDVLHDLGYAAIEAADGAGGLEVLRSDKHIDLLVTDVGLPGGINGRQVADAGQALRPGLKVLFITGYAENAAVGDGHLDPGMHVLTKPFAMEALASRIKDIIDAS